MFNCKAKLFMSNAKIGLVAYFEKYDQATALCVRWSCWFLQCSGKIEERGLFIEEMSD